MPDETAGPVEVAVEILPPGSAPPPGAARAWDGWRAWAPEPEIVSVAPAGSGRARIERAARLHLNKAHLAALRRKTAPAPPPPGAGPEGGPVEAVEVLAWPLAAPAPPPDAPDRPDRPDTPGSPEDGAEAMVGYHFADPRLLQQALTHSSHSQKAGVHNERMEFFGDAVLDLVVRERLFHQFPDRREGDLTEIKSALVRGGALAKAARRMGLDRHLRVGRGGRGRGRVASDSMLGDAFEALVAAIYLDGGYEPARQFILRTVAGDLAGIAARAASQNHKALLQQHAQRHLRSMPQYRLVAEEGPGHARFFVMEVSVGGRALGRGRGPNKKDAEQGAAQEALAALEAEGAAKPNPAG